MTKEPTEADFAESLRRYTVEELREVAAKCLGCFDEHLQRVALTFVERLIIDEFLTGRTAPCPSCDWPRIIARAVWRCRIKAEQFGLGTLDLQKLLDLEY